MNKLRKFKSSSYELKLTRQELIHLRDLFSILLPPNGETTLSEQLAIHKDREVVENSLWEKIYNLCLSSNISIEHKAPDFIVTFSSAPNITIVELPKTSDETVSQKKIRNETLDSNERNTQTNNKELFDMITSKKV